MYRICNAVTTLNYYIHVVSQPIKLQHFPEISVDIIGHFYVVRQKIRQNRRHLRHVTSNAAPEAISLGQYHFSTPQTWAISQLPLGNMSNNFKQTQHC